MIRQVATIAVNGFREASRNRVTVVIFAFALVLILSATVALEFTVTTFERVITDVGLGVMSLISACLTIFLGSGLIPREIERRTIFMVVSRPVSRSTFVVGRLLGNVLTVHVMTLVMAIILAIQFKVGRFDFNSSMQVAIVGFLLEAVLLSSVAIFFSTWSSQMVTVVSTIGLYFLGHASRDLFKMASKSESAIANSVGKALYYLLPNFDRLDFKAQATYGEVVAASDVMSAALYAIGYAVALMVLACAVFEKRDFK